MTLDAGVAPDVTGPAVPDDAELWRAMLRIRRFEERCAELYSAGTIRGFVHLYVGEEAVAVGVMSALEAQDAVVSTYRDHGHALARGLDLTSVMAEMLGRVTGCSRGRGGSMHLFDASRRFYGGNGIVAGGLPVALGLALADAMRAQPVVTACFFGDGAFAEGELHEVANLAALWRLPLLLVCENNLYAMGTEIAHEHAQTDLALRASSYGLASWAVDGMDVLAVREATRAAVESIRSGGGPHFLETRTYRFRAHSMYDPDRYRSKTEIAAWRERDPLVVFGERLPESQRQALEIAVTRELDNAQEVAEAAPVEPVEDLGRFLYSERPP